MSDIGKEEDVSPDVFTEAESPSKGEKGILIHSLESLFSTIKQREKDENRIFIVKCAYFEIYNDQVYDLLTDNFTQNHEPLQVLEDTRRKEFVIRNLQEIIVESLPECLDLLKLGEKNRSYAATKMNHCSSRSHTLYRLTVQSMPKLAENDDLSDIDRKSNLSAISDPNLTDLTSSHAVLNFIDLAGSERASIHE